MSGQFDFLKNKNNTKSREDFIEGANKETTAKKAKKSMSKQDLLLSIAGRIDRENECGKPTLIYIKNDIKNDIDRHCHGNQQAILNYLLRAGIESLKDKGELVIETE